MILAIIFDLDGTLVDLPVDWEALFDELKRVMHVDNVRPLTVTIPRTDLQTRKKAFDAWSKAELAVVKNVIINEEGMKIYRESQNRPKALVTMQGKKTAERILDQLKLKFDVVVTREDSLSREKQLLKAVEKLDIPARDILFVGDAESDATAAQKTGCQFRRIE